MEILPKYLCTVCLCVMLLWTVSVAQEEVPKPTFPDMFQVEVQGTFLNEKAEMDGSLFYDRTHNRAALFYTYQGDYTHTVYDFESDQIIYSRGVECSVTEITEETFFPFSTEDGKKKIKSPEDVFFFTNSELERQDIAVFPSYIYSATLDIPQYQRKNCEVTHIFSKPEEETPTCEGHACRPTLVAITVRCPKDGELDEVSHTYNFFRFRSGIADPAVFRSPPGVFCDVEGTLPFPSFPNYFSFAFDVTEKQNDVDETQTAFSTHKEVWYDAEFRIVRVDEFDDRGLLTSSRILDLAGKSAFTVIASIPTCDMGPINSRIDYEQVTRLPRIFFSRNSSGRDTAVYSGKRRVHELDYDVWSLAWTDEETDARVVEEIFFIEISPNTGISSGDENKTVNRQVSHVNIYTYQLDNESRNYDLSLVTHMSINNFRSAPKDWSAFDISSCFERKNRREFVLQVTGPPIVKGSQAYQEILELLYRKIVGVALLSILRINELSGIFDGVHLSQFKGSILDNSKSSGWPGKSPEPGMDVAYRAIEKAAREGDLNVTLGKDTEKEITYAVTLIEKVEEKKADPSKDCFSGASLAEASLVLFLVGISFGVVGYYVFLKRRKSRPSDRVELYPVDLQ